MNLATGFEPQFRTSPVLDPIGPLLSKGKGADLVIGLRVESKRAAPYRFSKNSAPLPPMMKRMLTKQDVSIGCWSIQPQKAFRGVRLKRRRSIFPETVWLRSLRLMKRRTTNALCFQ